MPWRRDREPYRVWVSEIMLQQTRVEAVVPHYNRWMQSFPTVAALADAEQHDVLKNWEGLGYYSRARNLHAAARLVREQYAGALPSRYEDLRALPGIGDYTAGAILSIAHQQPLPAVDGNVRRVLSRLYDVDAADSELRSYAADLVDNERPGDFNQSLMELGARVCTPRSPSCFACPVSSRCDALKNGTIELRPRKKARKEIPTEHCITLVTLVDASVILRQRPATGLLAGLWEFPEVATAPAHAKSLGQIEHVFSHKRIIYDVRLSRRRRALKPGERFVSLRDVPAFALPNAQRKIMHLATSPRQAESGA